MTDLSFDQVTSPRLWNVAVDQLRQKIESGEIPVGTKLPSERVLCTELGISRVSLREALRVLQATGYVDSRQGSGTYARLPEDREFNTTLWFANDIHIVELLEMRIAIEPGVAAFSAKRRTLEDITAMQDSVQTMLDAYEEQDQLMVVAADAEFHRLIGLSVRNPSLANLMEGFQDQSGMERRASLSVPGQSLRAVEGHRQILEAIRNQDPILAAESMRIHLEEAMDITHKYAISGKPIEEKT